MPPNPRPIPRFIADSTQEGIPHGRFAERLAAEFREACERVDELPAGVEPPAAEAIAWFPERRWGGRVWVPATARVEGPASGKGAGRAETSDVDPPAPVGDPAAQDAGAGANGGGAESAGLLEVFGHVSYTQAAGGEGQEGPGGEPGDLRAWADFTDVLAEDFPEWRIDLNDDVIGHWRGENGRAGDVTLVWGRPLVRGAVVATAELELETVDQEVVTDERFTLIALDALKGYGDDVFMEVKLWSRRALELASESLYA
jgi:hypothetical protein